ncbi:class I SAM-dependent methyltransferase [Roseomonas sp. NAR14]|uniref:Class I SAM-dependent methyltransferase n=1 Tax=Roseomonas acroporae TaxID=2937791 RepID=A0A9X1YDR2_9PROT|nr:class I SAM-dependent methyltransferase [Roseomonas acroporae]
MTAGPSPAGPPAAAPPPAGPPAGAPAARFTEDWFEYHTPAWRRFFDGVGWDAEAPHVAVEIGSFEGRSTIWILENLLRHPDSRIHCLDTFAGGVEHQADRIAGLYERFDANLRAHGVRDKAAVLRGPSFDGLVRLLGAGVEADFVYVDGSHQAPDVLADLVLGFRLLRPGGVMICDDYLWSMEEPDTHDLLNAPKIAIDAFANIHRRQIELPDGLLRWQFGLRRRAPEPG